MYLDAIILSRPASFIIVGEGNGVKPLLRIDPDGSVFYQGRLLGTDKEIYEGLRAVLGPLGMGAYGKDE